MPQLFLPKFFTFTFKFFVYILIVSVFDCIESMEQAIRRVHVLAANQ